MEFTPPHLIKVTPGRDSIFLAGTIDLGNSDDWQKTTSERLQKIGYDILNPRRPDWDSSWKQEFEDPQFYQQVSWELNAMEQADYIIMNFLADSKSPITLLELGLHASSKKLLVCCPKEFWRSGNVEVVCSEYQIPLYRNLDQLIAENFSE